VPYQQQQQQQYPTYPQQQYLQQPQYNTGMYVPQGTMSPPNFPPVYYPPPPRQPLMKAETADFLKRLTIALIIMGTVFGVILTAVKVASEVFQNTQAARADAQVQAYVDPKLPLDEQLEKLRQARSRVTTPSIADQFDRQIASVIAQQGQQAEQRGNTPEAEKLYRDAIEKDKNNPSLYTYLAKLYETQAGQSSDPELWNEAAQNWRGAWANEKDGNRRASYGEAAAISNYNYANMILNGSYQGGERAAREALYNARETAPQGSDVAQRVEQLLNRLVG
jgi:tetratricopeptide (TPR) repeat protein